MKITLTSVPIDNYDKALKFYTEVLGFVKKRDIPFTAFQVDDIQKELGVAFTMEPTNMGMTTLAVFNDTCGNLIQLYQV